MNEAQRNERHAPVNHCAVSFPHTQETQCQAEALGVMFAEVCGALAMYRVRQKPEDTHWVRTSMATVTGAVAFHGIVASRMATPSHTNTAARAHAALSVLVRIAVEIGAMEKGVH